MYVRAFNYFCLFRLFFNIIFIYRKCLHLLRISDFFIKLSIIINKAKSFIKINIPNSVAAREQDGGK